jgi:hypothetical protein
VCRAQAAFPKKCGGRRILSRATWISDAAQSWICMYSGAAFCFKVSSPSMQPPSTRPRVLSHNAIALMQPPDLVGVNLLTSLVVPVQL